MVVFLKNILITLFLMGLFFMGLLLRPDTAQHVAGEMLEKWYLSFISNNPNRLPGGLPRVVLFPKHFSLVDEAQRLPEGPDTYDVRKSFGFLENIPHVRILY